MKKVFLDHLPKYGKRINWVESVGFNIRFIYDDIEGEVKIIGYDKNVQKLKIKYKGIDYIIRSGEFSNCRLGSILGKITSEFKIEIGQRFIDDNRDLTIIDRKIIKREHKPDKKGRVYISTEKYYKYKCNICGFDGNMECYKNGDLCVDGHWVSESNLLKSQGCGCCFRSIVVPTINSVYKTDYWMVGLGVNEEQSKTITKCSERKIDIKCPYCGKKMAKICGRVFDKKSIGCSCSDGQSYISKYVYSLLKQLKLNFDTEVRYDWNKYYNPLTNRRSKASIDFVIYSNGKKIPLEADGDFHRKDNKMNGQTKEISEYIDKQRDENCLKYLGEETIRISDEGDIRENILNSKLGILFDLENIDWNKCEEFALTNKVKEVCDYWRNKEEKETTTDLSRVFKLDKSTIRKYLKKGTLLNWCVYDSEKELIKNNKSNAILNNKLTAKSVDMFDCEYNLIGTFESCGELGRRSEELFGVKLDGRNIYMVCNKKRKTHKGFIFKYAEDSQGVV